MTEHKVCKGCKWNGYPICLGTKMDNGEFMNIENLRPLFKCGQKDLLELTDFSIKEKTKLELLEEKVLQLEQEVELLKNP